MGEVPVRAEQFSSLIFILNAPIGADWAITEG